jgi:small subunit ribosomal protein S2
MSTGIQELLEAGVHFGHQTRRWNPNMKPYIFKAHNGVHIIDLAQTAQQLDSACNFIGNTVRSGGKVLLVGTKKQAQSIVREVAETNNQHYVTDRWLGGMLTNLKTVKQRLKRLKEIEGMEEDGSITSYVKQEQASIRREKARLVKNLGGIRQMDSVPDIVFIVDIKREHNAVAEARKLRIPIVAIVDTNCDPELIDYPIAGNDDALKSVQVIVDAISKTITQAKGEFIAKTGQDENPPADEAVPLEKPTEDALPAAETAPAEKPTKDASKAEDAADQIYKACKRLGTDEKGILNAINLLNSTDEWRAVKSLFQSKYSDFHNGDIIKCLNDELNDKEMEENVHSPLKSKGIEL